MSDRPHADGGDLLTLDGIGVTISGHQVLRNVRVGIRPGEFTGLIGPNGAGKTTLLRVILGLQVPTSGRVLIDGVARPRGMRRRGPGVSIGYVPQKFLIDPDMPLRVRDVVALGLDGHRLGFRLPSRARRALVAQTLRSVGADRYAGARVGELSGGEAQRVLIAHALISRPRLLLLDEPLANLDIRSAQEIVSLLSGLVAGQGIGVLMSAHDMNPLAGVMDRVVYVARGRAAVGRTEEVVRQDVLSDLYGHHVDVINVHGRILIVAGPGGAGGVPEAAGDVPEAAGGVPEAAGGVRETAGAASRRRPR